MSLLYNHKTRSSAGSLARGNSTGAAIRRGELKISDPIPIPREGVDNLGPQTGVASPSFQSVASTRNPAIRTERPQERTSENLSQAVPALPPTEHQYLAHRPQGSAASNPPSAGFTANPHDSMSTMASKSSQRKKRKDSTLRSMMRKIFGSKAREEGRPAVLEDHHRSDPVRLARAKEGASNPRSSSMPIPEITRASALGSHAPFAPFLELSEDPAAQEATTVPRSHRRRATLPSIVLSQDETREGATGLTQPSGLTLEPAGLTQSSQDRQRIINTPSEGYESAIGYAQTTSSRRRSRSASGLRESGVRDHQMSPIQWRRRSDEIRFWRNSVLEQPLPQMPGSRPASTSTVEHKDVEENQSQTAPSPEPDLQDTPFDFGPLIGNIHDTESATLEQRVTTLEVKSIDLEYAVAKLQGRQQSFGTAVTEGQRGHGPPTFLTSPTRSVVDDSEERPTSIANTVRPMTAVPEDSGSRPDTPPRDRGEMASHSQTELYSKFIFLIKAEEAARKSLERRVLDLQKELQELRSASKSAHRTPRPEFSAPLPPMRRRRRPSSLDGSHEGDARPEESDPDDGFVDVYETPAEVRQYNFGMDTVNRPAMVGII